MAGRSKARKGPSAKATAREEQKQAKLERIQHIIRLMTTPGGWVNGVTATQLADHYGVHQTTLDREAAEASRHLKSSALIDRAELRARVNAQVERLVALATKRNRITDALRGLELLSKNYGLQQSSLELTGKDGGPVIPGVVILPPLKSDDDTETAEGADHLAAEPGTTD